MMYAPKYPKTLVENLEINIQSESNLIERDSQENYYVQYYLYDMEGCGRKLEKQRLDIRIHLVARC